MAKYHIYIDSILDGTPIYVGKGVKKRIDYKVRNSKHARFIKKYGFHRTIIPVDSEQEAFEWEIFYIDLLKLNCYKHPENYFACNMTDGGEGVSGRKSPHSEETKRKMSATKIGKEVSNEVRKKISEKLKGQKLSEETKKKMSESKIGKIKSEEHKNKLSESLKGRTSPNKDKIFSEETKKKMSEAQKKRFANNPLSEETKKNMSEAQNKRFDKRFNKLIIENDEKDNNEF